MNAALVAAVVLLCFYFFGFRFYSGFLARRVWHLEDSEPTPAHRLRDGVDYVPTRRSVLFGHHFTSIAGAAPIVGPAIAVIWGWVPALLWVVLGTLLMGAVHDFGCLVLSARHDGRSMGDIAARVVNPRTRTLFLLIIFFLIFFVLAVFAFVIATLFVQYPSSVIPINFEIVVAILIGYLIHRRGMPILWPSIGALVLLYGAVFVGIEYPISVPPLLGTPVNTWIVFLLIYSFIASVLPVWLLLQPRDFINSYQLLVGLGLMFAGLFVLQPEIVAPALNLSPEGAPPWMPFLFVTIACGAISGFHGLVSSGTTAKQLDRISDARPIGYGAMLGEGSLALMATLACTAGFAELESWTAHYHSWGAAAGLGAKLSAFVGGTSHFMATLGIPLNVAETVVVVLIISFAATLAGHGDAHPTLRPGRVGRWPRHQVDPEPVSRRLHRRRIRPRTRHVDRRRPGRPHSVAPLRHYEPAHRRHVPARHERVSILEALARSLHAVANAVRRGRYYKFNGWQPHQFLW